MIANLADILHSKQFLASSKSRWIQFTTNEYLPGVWWIFSDDNDIFRNESKVFYPEISTSLEKNSSPSGDDKMQGFLRRTRSTSPKKVLSNSRIPFLKTNYLSRKSLSRKSVERSPRAQNSLKSDQSLLHVPVTGHQFSRLSGVSDR